MCQTQENKNKTQLQVNSVVSSGSSQASPTRKSMETKFPSIPLSYYNFPSRSSEKICNVNSLLYSCLLFNGFKINSSHSPERRLPVLPCVRTGRLLKGWSNHPDPASMCHNKCKPPPPRWPILKCTRALITFKTKVSSRTPIPQQHSRTKWNCSSHSTDFNFSLSWSPLCLCPQATTLPPHGRTHR